MQKMTQKNDHEMKQDLDPWSWYLQDGNGEIDQEEMEEVFSKLCRIVNCEIEVGGRIQTIEIK